MPWTPEQIDQLRALAPLSSPLEISRILGMTKNAVMGKMHRLNIAIRDARKPRPILRSPTEILREREARLRSKSQAVAWSNRRRAERNETWTVERVAMLRLLAPRGSSAIASEMGLTKPQVKAKARRLGIALGRPGPKEKAMAMASRVMRPEVPPPEPVVVGGAWSSAPVPVVPLPVLELVCEGVDFAGLKHNSCRWPVADDARGIIRLYCGESAVNGGPYCPVHKALAVTIFERKRVGHEKVWLPPREERRRA